MQISLKWINELVDIETVNLENLIEKLTLGGFEVEEILEIQIENQSQLALDISATANRSDSLSIQGISSEISTLLNKTTNISDYSCRLTEWNEQFKNLSKIIETNDDYSMFLGVVVENLTEIKVPKWIQHKLISSGLSPQNSISDFQDYIILETGYPFAFYDYNKICSSFNQSDFTLSIDKAKSGEQFLANNDTIYTLDSSTLLVKANDTPISIGGIVEHQNFACSKETNSLLIEASIFNAAKIRQQSRSIGLRTDRSARYEKSLKNTFLIESLYRLIWLLKISNPNLVCRFHTAFQSIEETPEPILLKYQTINEILGPLKESTSVAMSYIEPSWITAYLKRLNFEYVYHESNLTWSVQIPHSRTDDLTREIDLIEEIGRLHGFNNFLTSLPKIKTVGNKDWSYQTRKKLTSSLLNLGLTEFIHYSLINENKFINHKVKLVNPLVNDYSNLRVSLLPNLLTTVQENLKQGNSFVEGFEYGHVFFEKKSQQFSEKEYIAGIFGGAKTKLTWSSSAEPLSWFEAKGKMEKLFKELNILVSWTAKISDETDQILHPYRSAELSLKNGQKLGIFGQIHPIIANKLTLSSEIYLFELDLDQIQKEIQTNQITIYKDYSTYPKIIKDLSFIIEQTVTFEDLQNILYCNGTQFLTEINLLDEYKGPSIPDTHRSLCLQLVFQSSEKTLQNKKIETIISNLQLLLTNKFSATIRQ